MDVREALNRIFQEVFRDDALQITPETTANDVAGWDSFSHTTLMVAIETRFKITFALKEGTRFESFHRTRIFQWCLMLPIDLCDTWPSRPTRVPKNHISEPF